MILGGAGWENNIYCHVALHLCHVAPVVPNVKGAMCALIKQRTKNNIDCGKISLLSLYQN